ncbi:MAG: vWA domain-containing protein [Planctomycetota bacterium]
MKSLAASLVCLTVLACAPAPAPAPREKARRSELGALPQSGERAGRKIEVAEEGPWTIRRVEPEGSSRKPADGRGPAAATKMDLAEGEDHGDDRALGGLAVATGARPSAPGTPAAEPAPVEAMAKAEVGHGGRRPGKARSPGASPLRAGSTDDNAEYDAFLEFLAKWSDRPDLAGRFQMLDVRDRRYVRVVTRAGKPVPAAEVRVVDEAADRILLAGTTYGDGRVPLYPHAPPSREAKGPAAVVFAPEGPSLIVEVGFGGARKRVRWDGKSAELTVEIDAARPVADPVKLDVCILLDTTGSMSDEIEQIKATLLRVTERLRSLSREFDLRYGAVLYRDLGDVYVTKSHPFTGDIRAFDRALKAVKAGGGGDTPESMNQGLAEAVGRMDWREGAAKVLFLIADAPPHMDYDGDVSYGTSLSAAVEKGIRIHSVAASGLEPLGSLIFRQIAQFARGKFVFIEYGTVEKSAAAHGVKGKTKANNLDDILFEQIREEVARWGRGS